jgi:hypothetical protein
MELSKKKITQHPQRYSKTVDGFQVSASGSLPPLKLKSDSEPTNLYPYLSVDGIVVEVGDKLLVSQNTLDLISSSLNPHYDIVQTGKVIVSSSAKGVRDVTVGKTIPVVKINNSGFIPSTSNQLGLVKKAAVRDITTISSNPKLLLDQINYTLDPSGSRPADTFTLFDLNLKADYSIDVLKIQTAQKDGTLDKTKLQTFLTGVNDRLKLIREDFNKIKSIFYNGSIPEGSPYIEYTKVASTEDSQTTAQSQVVIKTTDIVGFDTGSLSVK